MPKGMIKSSFISGLLLASCENLSQVAMIASLLFLISSLTEVYIMHLIEISNLSFLKKKSLLSGLSRAHGKKVRSCEVLASRNLHGENSR